jgi:hypothetical protein
MPIISPELHGLLDEIVKDPRSALRLKPRRALLPWLDSGESVGANPLHASHAEKYLLAAHRDELAKLLAEGAWIRCQEELEFLQTPRRRDGVPVPTSECVAEWKSRRQAVLMGSFASAELSEARTLVLDDSVSAHVLATASLALAPSDRGRYSLALSLSAADTRSSIRIFQRIAARPVNAMVKSDASNILGAVLARMECVELARDAYLRSFEVRPEANLAIFSLFNLSCFAGDDAGALRYSRVLQQQSGIGDLFLLEAVRIIGRWARNVSRSSNQRAIKTIKRVHGRLSPPALALAGAVEGTNT